MRTRSIIITAFAGLILAGDVHAQRRGEGERTSSSSSSAASSRSDEFSNKYGILTERNIFVRNRPRISRGPVQQAAPRRPEENLVVRGFALQDGRNVAFVENLSSRETQRVLAGESVGPNGSVGKIVEIKFDALELESNGRTTRIEVGENFLGERASASAAAPPSSAAAVPGGSQALPTTRPAGAEGPATLTIPMNVQAAPPDGAGGPAAAQPQQPPIDPSLSVEERMRQQRMRDLGEAPPQ
jgi:hypothetical protein